MQYQADQKKEVFDKAYRGLLTLEPDRVKQAKYLRFIDIYTKLTDNELQQWQQQYLEDKPNMAGYAEYLRQEGKKADRKANARFWNDNCCVDSVPYRPRLPRS